MRMRTAATIRDFMENPGLRRHNKLRLGIRARLRPCTATGEKVRYTPRRGFSHLCSAKGETDDDTLCKILFRFGCGCVSLPLSAPAVRARHHAEQPVRNGPEHHERSPHDH